MARDRVKISAARLERTDSPRDDRALDVLRRAVVSGPIRAVELSSVSALARELGVSLSLVPEAMLTLVNEGSWSRCGTAGSGWCRPTSTTYWPRSSRTCGTRPALRSLRAGAGRGLLTSSAVEHCDALADGDPDRAERLMRHHLSHITAEWSSGQS